MSAVHAEPAPGGARRARIARRWTGPRAVQLAMLIPVVVLMGVFFGWPLFEILMRSLHADGSASFDVSNLSFGHYSDIVGNETVRRVMVKTFVVGVISTVVTIALAFPTAYLLTRLRSRLAAAMLLLILLPFWVSIVVRLFSLTAVLGRKGVINSTLGSLGLGGPHDLLFNTPAVVIGMVAYLLPYMILFLYAGLSGIDTSLLTAARTVGASRRQAFLHVYVPLARPTVISSLLLTLVLSLGFFLTPAILGGPQDTTAAIYIQSQISNFAWGRASAIGIVLLVVTVVGYALAVRLSGSLVVAGSGGGSKGATATDRLRLGPGSVLLWVVAGLVLVFLLSPLLVIVRASFDEGRMMVWPPQGFTLDWYSEVFRDPMWVDAIAKSVSVAAATAAISVAMGLLLARRAQHILSARRRALFDATVFAPLIVPVILLAVGLYSVETRLGMVGSDIGLILAHAVIAVPVAFAVLVNALMRMDPAHETAAWTLGASRTRAFWTVVVPPILPSLMGAFVIAFVTSFDEAVISLFLSGFQKTLPVTIFSEVTRGGDPTLAAISTMLIGVIVFGAVLGGGARAAWRRWRQVAAGDRD